MADRGPPQLGYVKILLLSSELVPERAGGVATYTAAIAPALAARGHDVHVLSCAPEHERRDDHYDGVWWHRRRLLGGGRASTLDRYRQTATRLATAVTCLREFRRLRGRFDVIESPEWLAESLFVAPATRVPVVVNLHTPLHILFSFDVKRFGRDLRIADRLERFSVGRAALVTSASELLAETLRSDGWLRGRPRIVPLPVDAGAWGTERDASETEPNVLVVGRLEPRKAPEVVVEAAAILGPHVPGLRVTFVGRSRGYRERRPYGEWVAKLAERKGIAAAFVPQVAHHEMARLYSDARVVAVPSRFESFSIATLEAMAAGRPVVHTSTVGAAEILRGSKAGTEVPANDPGAMADGLRPYLLDATCASESGRAGRELTRRYLRPDIIAEQRERCYEEAVALRKGTT